MKGWINHEKNRDKRNCTGGSRKSISNKRIFSLAQYFENLIPLITSDKLLLCAYARDFLIDGFHIYRFKDVTKVKLKSDLYNRIISEEKISQNIVSPEIDISDWRSVFKSLSKMNINVIIEKQTYDDEDSEFVIGKIEKICSRFAYVRHFDADGEWEDAPRRIPYSEITNIQFQNRYINYFTKYIATCK